MSRKSRSSSLAVLSSMAGSVCTPAFAPAARAAATPRTLSWSVTASTRMPEAAALETSSSGVSVPSESFVWV